MFFCHRFVILGPGRRNNTFLSITSPTKLLDSNECCIHAIMLYSDKNVVFGQGTLGMPEIVSGFFFSRSIL